MRHVLQPHCSPSAAVFGIAVHVGRAANGDLTLHYYIQGEPGLLVPTPWAPSTHRRADELWLHTCLEAFVKPAGGEAYWEFNIAPTGDWQAYHLDGYRSGRRPADAIGPPALAMVDAQGVWEVRAHWQLSGIVPADVPWQVGLAAVIEDASGIVYWALQQAPDQPDFHHASAFALTVPVTP